MLEPTGVHVHAGRATCIGSSFLPELMSFRELSFSLGLLLYFMLGILNLIQKIFFLGLFKKKKLKSILWIFRSLH